MKKTLIKTGIGVIITFSTFAAYSQDEKPAISSARFMAGITGGISVPSGNFTSTDYGNDKAGFAGSGYNLGLTGTWFIERNFGITALLSYHQYSYHGINSMAAGFQDAFDVDSASASQKGTNHSFNILVGPYYSIPLTSKFSIDLRLLGGITNNTLAGYDVVLTDAGITHPPLTQNTATATSFGMQGGVALRYNVSRHWALMLNTDYFYSKPDFTIVNVDRNANAGREITSYNQPIAGVNTNLTLVYLLKH